jgi:hypothetical protein
MGAGVDTSNEPLPSADITLSVPATDTVSTLVVRRSRGFRSSRAG